MKLSDEQIESIVALLLTGADPAEVAQKELALQALIYHVKQVAQNEGRDAALGRY